MALVDSIDYVSKRIYLSADTLGAVVDTLDIYREIRELRVSTAAHRNFKPIIIGGGNVQKTLSTFTPRYTQLLHGCRIVPYDTSHTITITRETFTDDNVSGVDVFDLSPLSPGVGVNIFIDVQEVEIRIIETGVSGLTPTESAQLANIDTIEINQEVINVGVQKSSILIPHNTNL